jgi:2'-5' RNA ligase
MTMRKPDFYRYFFAFHPDLVLRCWLASLADSASQHEKRIKAQLFHLTLCVIAELQQRDRFIVSRARSALDGRSLFSCPFWLGRVRGGRNGAAVHAMGRQRDIQDFYRTLIAHLAERGILPLHRNSGLRPHTTLGYDPCLFEPFKLPRQWIPGELLLIESEVGNGDHNVLARWPLLPPRQGAFAFESPLPLRAAGGFR